jgi:hypothetical protein
MMAESMGADTAPFSVTTKSRRKRSANATDLAIEMLLKKQARLTSMDETAKREQAHTLAMDQLLYLQRVNMKAKEQRRMILSDARKELGVHYRDMKVRFEKSSQKKAAPADDASVDTIESLFEQCREIDRDVAKREDDIDKARIRINQIKHGKHDLTGTCFSFLKRG